MSKFSTNKKQTSIHFQVDGVAGARQPRGVERHRGARVEMVECQDPHHSQEPGQV